MKKKIFVILGIVFILVVVGVVAVPLVTANLANRQTQASYQTETARLGSLTSYVGATGAVRADQTAVITWQASGRVGNVLVQKGDLVQMDAVLAELNPGSVGQALINARAEWINAQSALEKALDNSEARANAQLALVKAQQDLESAEKESQSKLYQRASQENIDIARAQLITANEALDNAEAIFNQNSGAGEDSPIYAAALTQLARARQDQQRADYNLRYAMGLPDPLAVEEVNAKLEQARVRLLSAQREWERVKDGPDPNDIAVAEVRVESALAALESARLAAPFDGTITSVTTQTGDLVSPGQTAFQVADLSRLLVDIQVSEVDINRVQVGHPVLVTFDAIAGNEYAGKVTDIAAVGNTASGAVNFTVTVELLDFDDQVRPGMTAAANIAVSQLDQVLLVPSRAVRTQDGTRVVFVLRNSLPIPVTITLGQSSNNYSQILSGDLKEGDLVILNPPTTMIMGPGGMFRGQP